jgi:hypothetical protein
MSRIVGGTSGVVHTPARVAHHQPLMRTRIIMPPSVVSELVHEAVTVAATTDQLQQMIEELKGLRSDFDRDRAEQALEAGPYSGLRRFAPENKDQWYAFVGIVLAALAIILTAVTAANPPAPPTIIVQDHEQEIVRQLEEYINEQLQRPPEPGEHK